MLPLVRMAGWRLTRAVCDDKNGSLDLFLFYPPSLPKNKGGGNRGLDRMRGTVPVFLDSSALQVSLARLSGRA